MGDNTYNNIIIKLLKLVRIGQQLTISCSHQENTIVESAYKETVCHLRALGFDVKGRRSRYIPMVQMIFISHVKEFLGFMPVQIILINAIHSD